MLLILDKQKFARESETKITLYQGIPKGGKMEEIIQKSVELGSLFNRSCIHGQDSCSG